MSSEDRASSSAVLTNPFIEFAIKNPNSASTREVAGLRLSAEKFIGLLTAGTENTTRPNGINSISGYMQVQSDSSGLIKGYATTSATRDNLYGANAVTGRLQALSAGSLAEVQFITSNGDLISLAFKITILRLLRFRSMVIVSVLKSFLRRSKSLIFM